MSKILCPSARCERNALLIGEVQQTGCIISKKKLFLLMKTVLIISELMQKKKFHFTNNCMHNPYIFWNCNKCIVAEIIIKTLPYVKDETTIPNVQ
jgi:hypothetical protein